MNVRLPYRVPKDLKAEILEYCKRDNLPFVEHGKKTHGHVINKFIKLDDVADPVSENVKKFSNEIFETMGMVNTLDETYNGCAVFVMNAGGWNPLHVDPRHEESLFAHIRVNFLLSKPEEGGNTIINEIEYQLQEDESWFMYSSIWVHGVTEVIGNKPRIILSIGKYVDPKEVSTFLKNVLYNKQIYTKQIREICRP